jgi:hypothetical protein
MADDLGKLEPPRLFGRKRGAKKAPAIEPDEDATLDVSPPVADEVVPEEPAAEEAAADEPAEVITDAPAATATDDEAEIDSQTDGATDVDVDLEDPTDAAPDEAPDETPGEAPPAAIAAFEPVSETAVLEPPTSPRRRGWVPRLPQTPKALTGPRRPRPQRPHRTLRVPSVPAAAVAGIVAGAALVGLTWLAVRATGPSSDKLGLPLLVAIFVVAVVAGTVVLRLLRVRSGGTIAFLGTGLTAVLAILILSDNLQTATGAIVTGAMTIVAYVLAQVVTARVIDPA